MSENGEYVCGGEKENRSGLKENRTEHKKDRTK